MVAVGFPHPGKQRDDRVGIIPWTLSLPLAKGGIPSCPRNSVRLLLTGALMLYSYR